MNTHLIRRLLAGVLAAGMVAVCSPAYADPNQAPQRTSGASASAQPARATPAGMVTSPDDVTAALLGEPEALQAAEEALKDPRVRAEAERVLASMSSPISRAALTSLTTSSAPSGRVVSPSLSVGGCGFLQACLYFNKTEQRYLATGLGAAVGAAICVAGTPAACVVAAAVVAVATIYVNDHGVCNGKRLRVQFLPYIHVDGCVR